jgi:hypothetical protein
VTYKEQRFISYSSKIKGLGWAFVLHHPMEKYRRRESESESEREKEKKSKYL